MQRNTIHSLLPTFIAIGVVGIVACNSTPTGIDTSTLAIYGRVVDAFGNPVPNVGISLLFNYINHEANTSSPLIVINPNPVANTGEINFSVMETDSVTIRLLYNDTRMPASTMVNQYLTAGKYSVAIDVHDLPNQAYIVHMESSNDTTETMLIVHNSVLDDIVPLLRTDKSGSFTIPFSSLPIGRLFERTYENGSSGGWMEISNQLNLGIDGPGASNLIWSLQVNTTPEVVTLHLP